MELRSTIDTVTSIVYGPYTMVHMIGPVLSVTQNQQRLTLIASDPGISAALAILSISRMILIYLNYRFWLRKWKLTYAKFLNSFVLDRKGDQFTRKILRYT